MEVRPSTRERRQGLEQVGRLEVRILPLEEVDRPPERLELAEQLVRLERAASCDCAAAVQGEFSGALLGRVGRARDLLLELGGRPLRDVQLGLDELEVVLERALLPFGPCYFALELSDRFGLRRVERESVVKLRHPGRGQKVKEGRTCCFAASTRRSSSWIRTAASCEEWS